MTWNPTKAKKILASTSLVKPTRAVKKISGYLFKSGRELILLEENSDKVSVYVAVAPFNMPNVVIEMEYPPTSDKRGRHANIEGVAKSLGFSYRAYRLHIHSELGLEQFIAWYQYA
jgi:hypothetical protein